MSGFVRGALEALGLSSLPARPMQKRPPGSVLREQYKRQKVNDGPTTYNRSTYGRRGGTASVDQSDDDDDYAAASQLAGPPRPQIRVTGVRRPKKVAATEQERLEAKIRKSEAKTNALRTAAGLPPLEEEVIAGNVEEVLAGPPTLSPRPQTSKKWKTRIPEDVKPEDWDTFTPEQKWAKQPNLRVLELIHHPEKVRAEVKEPEYALRDAEIRDGIWHVMEQMEIFASQHFGRKEDVEIAVPSKFFKTLSKETAKVIGCVASGGPSGVLGWHNLFIDQQKRRALVMAIIGNVLTEHVFQHLFFGGTPKDIAAMTTLQEKYANEDGFVRNTHYAAAVSATLTSNLQSQPPHDSLPANFNNHVNAIIGALWTHLRPILALANPNATPELEDIFTPLHKIVTHAGLLSLHMRLDPHTVYHHEPVFKEDNFTSSRMEAMNNQPMRLQNPTADLQKDANQLMDDLHIEDEEKQKSFISMEKKWREELGYEENKRARMDNALTQICILDGVTAYRVGGWEASKSEIRRPVYENGKWKGMGVRARILTHGWMYCRWGRARAFPSIEDKEVGKRVHGKGWRKGGFFEFAAVEGVVDWAGMEKKGRDEAAKAAKAEAAGGEEGVVVDYDPELYGFPEDLPDLLERPEDDRQYIPEMRPEDFPVDDLIPLPDVNSDDETDNEVPRGDREALESQFRHRTQTAIRNAQLSTPEKTGTKGKAPAEKQDKGKGKAPIIEDEEQDEVIDWGL